MISVCIATYNGEKYIGQQLLSILPQLAVDDEIIVSDDGSTDNTIAVIRNLNDPHIHILCHNRTDLKDNFAHALAHSKGDIIFLCDQDDVWMPGKVQRCLEELNCCDLVVHDGHITDDRLNITFSSLFDLVNAHEGLLHNWAFCGFYGSAMAFKRSVLDAAMPFPDNKYIAHDWWIGLVAEMTAKVHFIKEPLYFYRRHHGTMTLTDSTSLLTRSHRTLGDKINSRISMLYFILKYQLTHRQYE